MNGKDTLGITAMSQKEVFGNALWISARDETVFPCLFQKFICGKVTGASLNIVGFGSFECFINGKRVCDSFFMPLNSDFEERGFPDGEITAHRIYVCRYDVKELLSEGKNVISVLLGNGWYTGVPGDKPFGGKKVCWKLDIEQQDKSFCVESDLSVRYTESFIKESCLTLGEEHDYNGRNDSCMASFLSDNSAKQVIKASAPKSSFYYSDCPEDKITEHISPVQILKKDGFAVYDAKKNISGFPVLKSHKGCFDTVEVTFSEELTDDGFPDTKYNHGQKCVFRTDGTNRILTPRFTWFGFRYFSVKGSADVTDVCKVHSDIDVCSDFSCDNDTLNWLYKAYINTQLCNLHSGIPSDCPHIERRGYTGDGQLTCETAMMTLDMQRLYAKWIEDISDCQDRLSGHIQYTAPYSHCGGGPGGWGCAIIEVPFAYYKQYGDTSFIKRLYPQMLKYFDYLEAHSENALVISDRDGEWCLGEWCTPDPVILPAPFVNNYFYIRTLLKMKEISKLTGYEDDIPFFEKRIEERTKAIMNAYFNKWDGSFLGGAQGADAFALDVGIGDERTKANFINKYKNNPVFDTGIFGTEIVTRLLFEYGEAETAIKLLTRDRDCGFGCWQKEGATTLYEEWHNARSHSHPMFGAVVTDLFNYILGIHQTAGSSGYDSIVISPAVDCGIKKAHGFTTTIHGIIKVSFICENGTVNIDIDIPEQTTASLCVNGNLLNLSAGHNSFIL